MEIPVDVDVGICTLGDMRQDIFLVVEVGGIHFVEVVNDLFESSEGAAANLKITAPAFPEVFTEQGTKDRTGSNCKRCSYSLHYECKLQIY